ncbi:hypothetical protein A1O3_04228 [Capronia epimyces CBS 606.96]|uniref:Xylanolytic transcriptional activator regulatory domain-containing protein n=1 Tax=Capronia epimyces CBS 606.96 TaxID=1182542 RepID=W9YY92_9EURO|nr:uncharacterized protein A1O3_04228 [Capronia epimyces CBS 606.96]EXJ87269.1 hypothetical protein A1O3_04228 [Capronia epimyces CBS 606.96]
MPDGPRPFQGRDVTPETGKKELKRLFRSHHSTYVCTAQQREDQVPGPNTLVPVSIRSKDTGCDYKPGQWKADLVQFHELTPFVFGKEPGFDRTSQELRALKQFYPIRVNRNYPFRSRSTIPWTKERIRSLLPPRATADRYIDRYLGTFEKTHVMLHIQTFREETKLFWQTPGALQYEWLSQFLMMLALGCPRRERLGHPRLVESFLDGAEAYLMQSQFLAKPNLTCIRAMAMMAIAKQIDMVAFDDANAVWSFLGLIIRLAMSLGLHRDPQWFHSMSPQEAEMRKRIWTTLVFMDSHNSLETGLPLILHPEDYDTLAPVKLCDQDLAEDVGLDAACHNPDDADDLVFQTILSRSFPDVLRIMRLVHRPLSNTTRRVVLDAEAKIRALRQTAADMYRTYATCEKSGDLAWRKLQGVMLEIYFCRVLLALHQPYVMTPEAASRYPESCWSALESALAILVHQRRLYDEAADPVSIEWFAELFKGDFFVAALFVAVGLRRKSFGTQQTSSGPDHLAEMDIAFQTLDACWSIWGSKVGLSVHHFKAHLFLGIVIAATKPSDAPLTLRIQEAATATVATVKAAMSQKDETIDQPGTDQEVRRTSADGMMEAITSSKTYTRGSFDVTDSQFSCYASSLDTDPFVAEQFLSEIFVEDPPFAWSFD